MENQEPEYDHQYEEQYDDQYSSSDDGKPRRSNAEMGMKIAIFLLLILLIVLGILFWNKVSQNNADKDAMKVEMDSLQSQAQQLVQDLDGLKFDNDTLNRFLQTERYKADSLMTKLSNERKISYSKLKQYERELGTLRTAMKGFVRQIDSLNTINRKLVDENIKHKKDISELRLKTEIAEEMAEEFKVKVQKGSQIKVSKISVQALNKRNKEAKNASATTRLVVSFDLTANELAEAGEREVYVRIVSPEGYDLQESQGATFDFEGHPTPYTASRSVDYQGQNLPVSIYYNDANLTEGQYSVYVYLDGQMIGSTSIILK